MKTVRYLCTREFESLLCRSSFGFFFGSLVPRVPIRRFESAARARWQSPPEVARECNGASIRLPPLQHVPSASALLVRTLVCDGMSEGRIVTRSTPWLRTQTANALSHSKFLKCLPRCEKQNAIEYAREELAALQKKRSQGKFRHERTHSSTRSRPATLLDGQTQLTAPRRCSTAKHS